MLGRSRAHCTTGSRSSAAAEVGHLHEHAFHWWRGDGPCSSGHAELPSRRSSDSWLPHRSSALLSGEALDVLFAALTAACSRTARSVTSMRTFVPVVLTSAPVYAPIVALLAFMYVRVSPWTLALFLVPAMAAQRLYGLYQEQRQLAVDLSTGQRDARAREPSVRRSAHRHPRCARPLHRRPLGGGRDLLARHRRSEWDLPTEIQDQAYLCGLVHDIGKIGLPPGLLEKPGALTLEERRQMQEHSAIGERILAHVDEYSEIATIVRHHHERIDGQGYPDGLADRATSRSSPASSRSPTRTTR